MTDATKSPTSAIQEAAIDMLCQAHYSFTGVVLETPHARGMLAAALPYLATPAPADNGAGMRVKPLVWTKYSDRSTLFAHTGVGMFFSLKPDQGVWHLIRHEESSETHTVGEDPDELKAFAQKRWEELVRSALVPATSVAEPSEIEALVAELLTTVHQPKSNKLDYWHVTDGRHIRFGQIMSALASRTPPVHPAPVGDLHILFDGPPSHESGRFVEVENDAGASINIGEWVKRADDLWYLVIPYPAPVGERDKALDTEGMHREFWRDAGSAFKDGTYSTLQIERALKHLLEEIPRARHKPSGRGKPAFERTNSRRTLEALRVAGLIEPSPHGDFYVTDAGREALARSKPTKEGE